MYTYHNVLVDNMAKTRAVRKDMIDESELPEGVGWWIGKQQRAYIRTDGKFVGVGYYIVFRRFNRNRKTDEIEKLILDDKIQF